MLYKIAEKCQKGNVYMTECLWLLLLVSIFIGIPYTYYKKGLRFCIGYAYAVSVAVFLRLLCFCYGYEGIFLSFVYSAQLFTFGIDGKNIVEFLTLARDEFSAIYMACLWSTYILCPILTVSVLLSFIKKGLDRTTLRTRFFKKVYIFTETNESILALANDICRKNKRAVVVFAENDRHEENSKMLFVSSNVYEIYKRLNRTNQVYICFNDTDTGKLLDKLHIFLQNKRKRKTELYVFTNNPVAYEVVDGIKNEFNDEYIKVVSTEAILMREILWDYPLFSGLPEDSNELTVSVLGVGGFGGYFAMNTLWCSVMPNCTLKLNLVDNDSRENILNRVSSNLPDGYFDIEIFEDNINTNAFFEKVKTTRLNDSDYILVSAGQDDLNVSVARKLRLYFEREGKHPFIITVLKNQSRYTVMKEVLKKEGIEVTGGTENMYSYDKIFEDRFFNRAFEVYRLVEEAYNNTATVEGFYRQKQIDIFSSYASAVHSKYKIYGLCRCFDADIKEIDTCISNNKYELTQLEHRRWVNFETLKGYIGVPDEKLLEFLEHNAASGKIHKNEKLKMHACITDLKGVEKTEQLIEEKFNKSPKLMQIDEIIAENTSAIWLKE